MHSTALNVRGYMPHINKAIIQIAKLRDRKNYTVYSQTGFSSIETLISDGKLLCGFDESCTISK